MFMEIYAVISQGLEVSDLLFNEEKKTLAAIILRKDKSICNALSWLIWGFLMNSLFQKKEKNLSSVTSFIIQNSPVTISFIKCLLKSFWYFFWEGEAPQFDGLTYSQSFSFPFCHSLGAQEKLLCSEHCFLTADTERTLFMLCFLLR